MCVEAWFSQIQLKQSAIQNKFPEPRVHSENLEKLAPQEKTTLFSYDNSVDNDYVTMVMSYWSV